MKDRKESDATVRLNYVGGRLWFVPPLSWAPLSLAALLFFQSFLFRLLSQYEFYAISVHWIERSKETGPPRRKEESAEPTGKETIHKTACDNVGLYGSWPFWVRWKQERAFCFLHFVGVCWGSAADRCRCSRVDLWEGQGGLCSVHNMNSTGYRPMFERPRCVLTAPPAHCSTIPAEINSNDCGGFGN